MFVLCFALAKPIWNCYWSGSVKLELGNGNTFLSLWFNSNPRVHDPTAVAFR